jgi:hypothetical protein
MIDSFRRKRLFFASPCPVLLLAQRDGVSCFEAIHPREKQQQSQRAEAGIGPTFCSLCAFHFFYALLRFVESIAMRKVSGARIFIASGQ